MRGSTGQQASFVDKSRPWSACAGCQNSTSSWTAPSLKVQESKAFWPSWLKSEPNGNNERRVDFKLNGEARFVIVQDDSVENESAGGNEKADAGNDAHVGAPMPGVVVSVNVEVGQRVEAGDALVTLSAMKMETVVTATKGGVVSRVSAAAGDNLAAGDLLIVVEDDGE